MRRIRLAIVGLGKIARDQHLPVVAQSAAFELVATVSPHDALPGVATFVSLGDLLSSSVEVDAISLCTPPQPRRDLARMALDAGKHVMLEKPPAATLSAAEDLCLMAQQRGVSLYATWHSQHAVGVAAAREWLAGRVVKSVRILWKEDFNVWHPGQDWIWEAGGLGVFDPGINALSIATHILPERFCLTRSVLHIPANKQTPARAELQFQDAKGAPIEASFDFLHAGRPCWDIEVETEDGSLKLGDGGARLHIDGDCVISEGEPEYASLYRTFARLIAERQIEGDMAPLRHVADAFLLGERVETAAL